MSNYDLFESYIFQRLSVEQSQEFENRLTSDTSFREDYENHLQVQSALDILVENDVTKVINGIKNKTNQKDISNEDKIKSIIPKRWMSIAAALFFLVAVGFIFKDKLSHTEDINKIGSPLYAMSYYDIFEPNTTRNGGADTEDGVINIYVAFGQDINKLVEAEKYSEAITLLQRLMSASPNTSYYDKAEWNLAILYAQYDKGKASVIIDKILSDPQHDYYDVDKVQKLKKTLK